MSLNFGPTRAVGFTESLMCGRGVGRPERFITTGLVVAGGRSSTEGNALQKLARIRLEFFQITGTSHLTGCSLRCFSNGVLFLRQQVCLCLPSFARLRHLFSVLPHFLHFKAAAAVSFRSCAGCTTPCLLSRSSSSSGRCNIAICSRCPGSRHTPI